MIVVDSSVLVAHLRGDEVTTGWLGEEQARGGLLVPSLVAWELWRGATTPARRNAVRLLLEATSIDPFGAAHAQVAAELAHAQREAGRERPLYDLLIASHALHHQLPLATLDRDYEGIDGLTTITR